MTTVFLSGSRSLTRIDGSVRERLDNMIERGLHVVVGDANGADKAMQLHLAERRYREVSVFCAGSHCRNNLGDWTVRRIDAGTSRKGRDFFAVKDRAMADEADYGLVLWDGRSVGSMNNVRALVARRKPVVIFVARTGEMVTLCHPNDLATFEGTLAAQDRRDKAGADGASPTQRPAQRSAARA